MLVPKKFLIEIIILTIIKVGLIFFIIFPTQKNLKILKEEIKAKENVIKATKEMNISKESTVVKLNDYLAETAFMNKVVIKKENQLEFINFLENLNQQHQTISNFDINVPYSISKQRKEKEQKANKKIIPLNINISLAANFNQFLEYLIDLEKADYYININSIKISAKDKEDLAAFVYKRTVEPKTTEILLAEEQQEQETNKKVLFITLTAETYWID